MVAHLLGRGEDIPAESDAVLICVPDAAIHEVCESLIATVPRTAIVGHVSGALTLSTLAAAARAGHPTFSMHPLQTIPDPATDLRGAPCAIAASDEDTKAFVLHLATRLGMMPFEVPEAGRAAYHAAAAIASNFLVALEESASELMAAAGVENPRAVLAPLVLRSAANWADAGGAALTGPIARGDEATVAAHREAIRDRGPDLERMYDVLAERTRALVEAAGR